ncbi:hypothetical protein MKW98_008821 [Papaver atlanticum]|uniref:ACT domain-containing protein ACR n=1 Tax=Papaver atlanticum TaxID=357466 RepID=A0AAD4X970_9MAGN|nr:hypothetical protein MKW98_008821 [Papaver atlanticum]
MSDKLTDHTSIELTRADRPGFLSEISAVLDDLRCKVVEAHAWSHNDHDFERRYRLVSNNSSSFVSIEGCKQKRYLVDCVECKDRRRLIFYKVCTLTYLCANNGVSLFSEITWIFHENSVIIVRADVATKTGKVMNAFYVRDISGSEPLALQVRNDSPSPTSLDRPRLSLVGLLKLHIGRLSQNFSSIK